MNFKTTGIVLKQRNYLSEQKYLTLLTEDRGLIDVKLRVFGQVNRNVFRNVNVMGYYQFNIFDGRYGCVIDSAEPIEQFFELRYDPKKLAIAQYFCELTYLFVPSKQRAQRHINLLLNALWLLKKDKLEDKFIKCVFELRLLSLSGYMPNLVCCKNCCSYEKEKMYYIPLQGVIICKDCIDKTSYEEKIELPNSVLKAMRYIIYKEDKDIFKFKLYPKHLDFLAHLVEHCVLIFAEKEPTTLNIYHQFVRRSGEGNV